jgi:hypothetical protein
VTVATPGISEFLSLSIVPSIGGVSAANEKVSCQQNRANDLILRHATLSGSQQASRLGENVISRGKRKSECQGNRLAAFETEVHHSEVHAIIEHTGTNTGSFV